MKRGVVYYVSNGEAIKIGMTAQHMRRRLAGIQYESAEVLTVLGTFPIPPASEYEAHKRFAHLRIGGEWFRHDPEILAYIEEQYMQGTAELRRQLKAIRDSRHPASGWARNLVQVLDEMTMLGDALQSSNVGHMTKDDAKEPMRLCMKQFQRRMKLEDVPKMSAAEIAVALGLVPHPTGFQ